MFYINCQIRERARESAYANLAGLFPFEINQKWNGTLDLHRIPVHSKPEKDDYRLDLSVDRCPQYMKLQSEYLKSAEFKEWTEKYTPLMQYLEKHSGMKVSSTHHLMKLHDALLGQMEMNR